MDIHNSFMVNTLTTPLVYYTAGKFNKEEAKNFFEKGVQAQQENNLNESFSCFKAAIRIEQNNPYILNNIASLISNFKDQREGAAILEDVLKKNPRNVEVRYNLGTLFLLNNNFKDAHLHLDQSASLSPKNVGIMNNLAVSYIGQGFFNQAKKILTDILEEEHEFHLGLHNLGHVLYQEKNYVEALAYFEQILEKVDNNVVLLNHAGCAAYLCGDIEKAISLFKKSIQIDFEYKPAIYNLGLVSYQQHI